MIWISVYHKMLSYLRKEVSFFSSFLALYNVKHIVPGVCWINWNSWMNDYHIIEKNKVNLEKTIFNQVVLFINIFFLNSHSLIPVIQIFSNFHCTSSYQCHVQAPILFDFRKSSPTAHVALKNAYTLHTCLIMPTGPPVRWTQLS